MRNKLLFGAYDDPTTGHFSQVTGLYHFDGTNGSSTMTDSSTAGNNGTATNGAVLSTTSPKYGTASVLLVRASSQYVDLGNNANTQLGAGDYTFEGWFKVTSLASVLGANMILFGKSPGGTTDFACYISNTNSLILMHNNSPVVNPGVACITSAGTWYHLAFTRLGTTCTIWFNGVSQGTGTSAYNINSAGNTFKIGYDNSAGATWALGGNVDDFRITKGYCRYTATFVPHGPFPNA